MESADSVPSGTADINRVLPPEIVYAILELAFLNFVESVVVCSLTCRWWRRAVHRIAGTRIKAALAHPEIAHSGLGDTKIGPAIYRLLALLDAACRANLPLFRWLREVVGVKVPKVSLSTGRDKARDIRLPEWWRDEDTTYNNFRRAYWNHDTIVECGVRAGRTDFLEYMLQNGMRLNRWVYRYVADNAQTLEWLLSAHDKYPGCGYDLPNVSDAIIGGATAVLDYMTKHGQLHISDDKFCKKIGMYTHSVRVLEWWRDRRGTNFDVIFRYATQYCNQLVVQFILEHTDDPEIRGSFTRAGN
jgi:hypothetical protein